MRFPEVGLCIYCGTKELPTGQAFSDEHIFPEGIGGDLELPLASCPTCATVTSQLERECIRQMFPVARAVSNAYGKRRKKQRPSTLPVVYDSGGEQEEIQQI
jgi:hypothetical protein